MSLLDDASLIVTPNGYKASKLYSVKPTDASGDMDVVRATTATRVNSAGLIESVAINVPRLDYTNASCPSILLEPLRTNLVLQSQDLSNSSWTKTNTTITANSITSPIASFNSDSIVENSASNVVFGVHANARPSGLTLGTTYSVSFFAKKITRDFCYFNDFNAFQNPIVKVFFNLQTGLVGNTSAGVLNPKMENYGNGWYRCSFQFVATISTSMDYRIAAATSGNTLTYSGTIGQQSISVTACQLEAGSNATSYIPTTTATVTRNADLINKAGVSSLIGQTEGTIYAEILVKQITQDYLICALTLDTGLSILNAVVFTVNDTGNLVAQLYAAGVLVVNTVNPTSFVVGTIYKVAFGYKSGNTVVFVNGTQVSTTDTDAFALTTLNAVSLSNTGYYANGGQQAVKSTVLFPTRLTNAQLATLTTP